MRRFIAENRLILAVLAVFVLAKVPSLATPFWWDEAGAYILPSLAVAKSHLWMALPGGHPKGFLHGHPPVLYLIHGTLYQLFGDSILPHRVAALAFALLGLWFTYRLGRLLCGQSTGVCAVILLACSPMFFAQSSMVLGDLPIAALGVVSAYLLFAGRWWTYAVAATLLLQTKETALAVGAAAAAYAFVFPGRNPGGWRSFLMHAVPLGSLGAFFTVEYLATGSFVQAPYFNTGPLLIFDLSDPAGAAAAIVKQTLWVARVLFHSEGRFLLAGFLLFGFLFHRRRVVRLEFALFAAVIALYWGAFSFIGFLPRYLMPVLPFMCIAASWSAFVIFRNRETAQYAAVGATALAFLPFFYIGSASGNFETNMRHVQAVAVSQLVCEYVEANFRSETVAADWPVSKFLSVPQLGYVGDPLGRVVEVSQLRLGEQSSPFVFVYFSIGPSTQSDALRRRAGVARRRFEEGGIFAEVYEFR